MKNYIFFVIGLFMGILLGFLTSNYLNVKNVNVGDNVIVEKGNDLSKESGVSNFYSNFNVYMNLLSDEDFKYFNSTISKYTEDKETSNMLAMCAFDLVSSKDERIKGMVSNLKNLINENGKINLTKEEGDVLFEKNNTCALLVNGIKDSLSKKYLSDKTEVEELDFIFYSPTFNSCLYSTTYTYTNGTYLDSDYYSTNTNIIYNASSNIQVEKFITYYSYGYPYLSKDEANDQAEMSGKKYKEFVLKNSNYNVDLFKN